MEAKVLHDNKQYLTECADVLNEEWKRSQTARLHSLEKSCDTFPLNLIFISDDDKVIGHSRLSIIQGKEKSCLIESVVVKKCLRGKGYGRKVMEGSEKFAARKGFETMYLSTHDKQDFYKHLGYDFCPPVISFGAFSANLPDEFMNKFLRAGLEDKKEENTNETTNHEVQSKDDGKSCEQSDKKSTSLPVAPPAPPPPCPPPPPPPPSTTGTEKTKPEITRWDVGAISWMKKQLS